MALIVEDGTGLADAESYNSLEEIAEYATNHGLTFAISPAEAAEAAARRATTWLDGTYRGRYSGTRLNGRDQALQWPREDATDAEDEDIATDEVPAEIKAAHAEAAIRELASPGALNPDFVSGTQAVRKKVGSIEVEYRDVVMGPEMVRPVVNVVDDILAPLLGNSRSPVISGESSRAW